MNGEKKFETVLIPFFGNKKPEKALNKAFKRVDKGGKIYLLHITDEGPTKSVRYMTGQLGDKNELMETVQESRRKLQENVAKEYAEKAKKEGAEKGISVELLLVAGDPAEEVIKTTKEYSIQLIVVESLREKLTEMFLGDEIDFLQKKAPCEVLKVF